MKKESGSSQINNESNIKQTVHLYRVKTMTECSYTIIDMNTMKQTYEFLEKNEENLPKSNKYYFFLDADEDIGPLDQSYILFSHLFFDKVIHNSI